jgi:hypothetical protein
MIGTSDDDFSIGRFKISDPQHIARGSNNDIRAS